MSTIETNPLLNDTSLLPAVAGQSPAVAGGAGNLGWANGPTAPVEAASGTSLLVCLHALRRHWLVAATLGMVCGAALGVGVWLFQQPQYAAVAVMRISANPDVIMFDTQAKMGMGGRDLFEIYKGTQQQLVKSRPVIEEALRKPEISHLSCLQGEADKVGWLISEVNVTFPQKESELMQVSLVGANKEEITILVNAVVEAYMSKIVDREQRERAERYDKLETLRGDKETEERNLMTNLKQLAESAGGTEDKEALSIRNQIAVQRYGEFQRELMRVQVELMRAHSQLTTAQQSLASIEDMEIRDWEVDQAALADPTSHELAQKKLYYDTALAQISNTIVPGTKNAQVKRFQAERDMVQQQIDEMGKSLREKIRDRKRSEADKDVKKAENDVAILTDQEHHFTADVDRQRREVEKIGKQSIDIELEREKLKNLDDVLASIRAEREKLGVERSASPRIIRNQIQMAEVPEVEYRRSMRFTVIGLTAVFGFCLPLFGVVLWDVRSRRVNAVSEVVRGLGLPVIGSVPTIPIQVLRRLGTGSKRSQAWRLRLTESIDGIAARLLRKAETEQTHVVLVSSAMAGEGKTTLARQLAMSMARHLRRTILVDFDLRRPTLDKIFDVPLEPGVCEALSSGGDIGGMIHPTGTEHLSVLPAGRWNRDAMAALANGSTGPLLKQLREQYDFVIIDSSPILPVADTRFVSQHADTVVLSVFRDRSEMPKIQAACEILDAFGVRNLETVVIGGSGFAYGRGRQQPSGATA